MPDLPAVPAPDSRDGSSDEARSQPPKSSRGWGKWFANRKKLGQEVHFADGYEEEDAAPNIVILNSLTHDQLMELLRAHTMVEDSAQGDRSRFIEFPPVDFRA